MSYSIFSVFAVLVNLKQNGCHVTVFILEKHTRRQFFEYTYKVKLAKFQLSSFRRSAVTDENSQPAPPPGKIGLSEALFFKSRGYATSNMCMSLKPYFYFCIV